MKYSVIGLLDLIVSNLPEHQSDLRTEINSSFSDLLAKFPANDVVLEGYEDRAPLDEVCSLAISSLTFLLERDGGTTSNHQLIKLLSKAEDIYRWFGTRRPSLFSLFLN